MEEESNKDIQWRVVNNEMVKAIRRRDWSGVDLCLKKGADINYQDGKGYTLLMIAAYELRDSNYLEAVLTKKPDLFLKNKEDKTVFDMVADFSEGDNKKTLMTILLRALPDSRTLSPEKEQKAETVISQSEDTDTRQEINPVTPVQLKTGKKNKNGGLNL